MNWFIDDHTPGDAIATKAFQRVRGREWVISPICIWEIFLTGDESRREKLIYNSQLLFSREMLLSPEELILDFIEKGFPKAEKAPLKPASCDIAKTWRNLVDDPNRTFIFDKEQISGLTKELRSINKLIDRVVRDKDVPLFGLGIESATLSSLEACVSKLSFIEKHKVSDRTRKIYKVAIFYMLMILCAGIGLNRRIIDRFWETIGINCLNGRLMYALEHFEPLVYRGPIVLLAMMTVCQSETKFSRGVYFDSLHAMYAAYSHMFFTADDHFLALREAIGDHSIASKMYHVRELQIEHHERDNAWNGSPIIT